MKIKCISLWQPWASLIVWGHKTIETRSWPAPSTILGTRIGIHAAMTTQGIKLADELGLLRHCGMERAKLPLGALVATCVVDASVPTEKLCGDPYGDFRPGRYGWILSGIEPLAEPIPVKGRQGIFTVELPD